MMSVDISGSIHGKEIPAEDLVELAKSLKSDDGENPEYDRALCELVGDALGITQEGYCFVADLLGITRNVWNHKLQLGAILFRDEATDSCEHVLQKFQGFVVDVFEVGGENYTATLVNAERVDGGELIVTLDVWESGDKDNVIRTVNKNWFTEVKEATLC